MNKPLQPLTRLILLLSALVPLVFSLFQLFLPSLANSLLWPPPFEPIPAVALRYLAAVYWALGVGGFYALMQNRWEVARGYLMFAGPYVIISMVFSIITAILPPGVPVIVWLYILLAAIYTVLFFIVWRQEAAANTPGRMS